jgi:hypothetical protein
MRMIWALVAALAASTAASANDVPKFQPEPFWPKPLPENWILGQVSGIAVDPNDHVWLVHRPGSLVDDEKGRDAEPAGNQMLQARASGAEV